MSLIFPSLKSPKAADLGNPLLSMNEAWMNECATRLQPLVDQYKHRQHQTSAIEKIRDLIVTTVHVLGTNKSLLNVSNFEKTLKNLEK